VRAGGTGAGALSMPRTFADLQSASAHSALVGKSGECDACGREQASIGTPPCLARAPDELACA
jgi:hypothetical protein